MSQILKFVDFAKTQKSRYLKKKTLFFLQIKKLINYTLRTTLLQKNSFAAEVTFNQRGIWRMFYFHFQVQRNSKRHGGELVGQVLKVIFCIEKKLVAS